MRCLQIGMDAFALRPGGLSRYHAELCTALTRSGASVRSVVVDAPDRPLPLRLLRLRAAIGRALAETDPELVAAHFALYAAPSLGALRRRPLVVHFHGPWAAESAAEGAGASNVAVKLRLESRVYRQARGIIALSQAFARRLVEDYRIDPARITVIPGGVDTARFASPVGPGAPADPVAARAAARVALGWPHGRPTVVAVRRLVRRMGLAELVAAIEAVRRDVPEVLLMIAGAGPLEGPLADQIVARGLVRHVRLLGVVPDAALPLVYRAADLAVMPSLTLEGFGLAAVESLASGTPVMVTPVGGLPDIVAGLAPQLVFADTTEAAIADSLREALLGRLALPTADACRAHAARYDWCAVVPEILAAYRRAI